MPFLNRGLAPLESFLPKDLRRTVGNVGKGARRIWVRVVWWRESEERSAVGREKSAVVKWGSVRSCLS